MCASSKNSVDSLKKKKLKQQSIFFLQHFLPHTSALNFLSILYIASMHYCRQHHSEHPGNILDLKALSCTPAHSTCKVQYMRPLADKENSPNGMHWRSQVHRKAGSPLTVISLLFQCHVYSTLKPRLPKYTLRPMKHLIPHQILGMESEGLTR